uniref:serine hydrolase domain-containing protein n=1 Tax=Flavobacterium sp. TaxID=239 RepID=UPI00404B3586
MKKYLFCLAILFVGCDDSEEVITPTNDLYFPPISGSTWETTSPESAGFNVAGIPDLEDFLSINGTRAFILLKDGKIVMEKYWGNNIANTAPFDQDKQWYWASAGKTLTATLTGIAQEEGFLNINNKTSDYLGAGWTNAPLAKENLITVKNQLTMTSGLDFNNGNLDCTTPNSLTYLADAGTQWFYHNGPYTLLESVVENATNQNYNDYTTAKIKTKTGMDGQWIPSGNNNVYWSTARSAARFGLLILNKGVWDETTVLGDLDYYNAMINTSQNINLSYGYLWWLNGKSSVVFPGSTQVIPSSIAPNAPAETFCAMGKNGQFIGIIPSQGLVYVRMGEAPDNDLVPIIFHNQMWEKLNVILN